MCKKVIFGKIGSYNTFAPGQRIVCDYHGDIIKEKDGEAPLKQYSALECNYMNLNATKCTFGHSDITSRKQQKAEK